MITAFEIADVVTFLFSQSYERGQPSKDWRNAHVIPVFKKGEKHDPCNYRPVSLTAVLCKIMEHISGAPRARSTIVKKIW